MTIREYTMYREPEILSLYNSVGWSNYTNRPGMLKAAFANSLYVHAAYEGDELAGLIRAVGDGVSIVFVQDILVRPEFQRRGIGGSLLRQVLRRYQAVYQIRLATDETPETIGFYRGCGLCMDADCGCCGFSRINLG